MPLNKCASFGKKFRRISQRDKQRGRMTEAFEHQPMGPDTPLVDTTRQALPTGEWLA